MRDILRFLKQNTKLVTMIAVGAVILCAAPAWAAGSGSTAAFGGLGDKLWDLGEGLIKGVGRGAVLLGGGWSVLAFIGRLGHLSMAISIFVAGIFLANLPVLVNYLFPG